jgi:hypothetical protein
VAAIVIVRRRELVENAATNAADITVTPAHRAMPRGDDYGTGMDNGGSAHYHHRLGIVGATRHSEDERADG